MGETRCSKVEIVLKGDLEKVLKDVAAEAAKNDIEIRGDTKGGTIKHKKHAIRGTYDIDDKKKVSIQMYTDTWLAGCSRIEGGIADFFRGK